MTPARLALALALAIALAGPTATRAVQWSARAGLGYVRDDAWRPGAPQVTTPRLDVDLSLHANGFVHQPDALVWSGGVDYQRLTLGVDGARDTTENRLQYRLQTTAFSRRTSPVSLSAFATRQEGDGSAAGGIGFGSTTQTFGGTFALRVPDRPSLEGGYSRSESEITSSLRAPSHTTRDSVHVGTAHSGAVYGFGAGYRGTFSDGTYAAENYDEHRVDVNARVRLARTTLLQITDAFYRREPTADSEFNPRQELNVFSAHLRHVGADADGEQRAAYQHTQAVTDSLGTVFSREAQDLTYSLDRPLPMPDWFVSAAIGANLDDRAIGSAHERTVGQTLRATGSWRKQAPDRAYELHAGPSFGLLEPFGGSLELGWGAAAGGSVQATRPGLATGAQYSVSYGTTLGTPGTSLSQQSSLTAEAVAGLGRVRGSLLASADRMNDRLFGSRASRALTARGEYTLRAHGAWIDADLRDGVAGALRRTVTGDGLFLAPAYDVHSRSIGAGARSAVSGLSGSAGVRLVSSDAPDRPTQNDLELRAELGFRTGAFGLSFEDRYIAALDSTGSRGVVNVFYFRVYRVIESGR